jgi:hypothetical protein
MASASLNDTSPTFLAPLPGYITKPSPRQADLSVPTGSTRILFYIAGATHLIDFTRPLWVTAFKAGLTRATWPGARIEDLRMQRYASLLLDPKRKSEKAIQFKQPGEWFLCPLDSAMLDGAALPDGLAFHKGGIMIDVPDASFTTFDLFLHRWLKARSLQEFLATDDGRARMTAAGYDCNSWLHTAYHLVGEQERISAAREIYMLKPRLELPLIVAALAGMRKSVIDIARKAEAADAGRCFTKFRPDVLSKQQRPGAF